MRAYRSQDEREQTAGSEGRLLLDLRESFAESFAYDFFSWISIPPSKVTFRPTQPAGRRDGEDKGTGATETDGPVALYTTTNSDIAITTIGEVVPIEGDGGTTLASNTSGPLIDVDDFRADARFAGVDGSGYSVVVLDTGIDLDDPFFGPDSNGDGVSDRIVYHYDFADGDADASDVNGHGSNVTSIAASSDGTYTGMAPGADIISLKVFTNAGTGNFGYVEQALQWVINNADAYNIASINMSLSDSGNYSTAIGLYGIADELSVLASMDVIVVSASGNDFYEVNSIQGVAYPSADPNSLSVGAVYDGAVGSYSYLGGAIAYSTTADQITPFSQRDHELSDIFAPGAPITGAGAGGGLVTMHGTSQASPHIAGIAALAQQLAEQELGRKLTVTEFTDLLASSGDSIFDGDDENDNVANTGVTYQRVNVLALAEAILALPPTDPVMAVFSIAADDATKPEGDSGSTSYSFVITRSGDTSGSDSVDYSVSGSGHEPSDAADFQGSGFPGGQVTFAAGETSKTITVDVAGDTGFEADEGFTVTLSNPSAEAEIDVATASGVIQNDDSPLPGQVVALIDADFNGTPSGTEGFSYVAGVFGGTTNPLYTRGNWTASEIAVVLGGGDGTPVLNMSGGWERSFTLLEEMEVSLSFLYRLVHSGQTEVAEFTRVVYSIDGGPPQVIAQATGDGNGGPDHIVGPTTFETSLGLLGPGTHRLVLGGILSQKNVIDEYSTIYFDDVLVTAFIPSTTTNFLEIAALDAVQDEGDDGATAFTFTVTRSGDTSQATSVDYSVSGAEVDGGDFVGGVLPSGNLSFAAGETSKILTIEVAGDSQLEGDEAFTVTLANASIGAEIVTATAAGSIVNDDAPPPEPIVLLQADFDQNGDTEGFAYVDGLFGGANPQAYADGSWSGQALGVTLGGQDRNDVLDMSGGWQTGFTVATESEVTLSFAYNLTIDSDYESSEFTQVLVSIDGGPPTLVDQLTGDGNGGSDQTTGLQTFTLALGTLAAGSHSLAIGAYNNRKTWSNEQSQLTIDDVLVTGVPSASPPAGSAFAIVANDAAKAEGDAGSTVFTFTVSRSGDSSQPASVDYAVSGRGADQTDFFGGLLPSGTLDFAAGETSKTLTVEIAGDTDFEGDEAFTVTLVNPSGGSTIATASADGTILNDDPAPPSTFFAIAAADATKDEGDAGATPFTFTVTRSGDSSAAGSVDYAVAGIDADSGDFTGGLYPSGTVSFAAGETSKTLTINVSGDTVFENDEGFSVTLSNASAGSEITTASASGTIVNDDPVPTTSFFSIAALDAVKAEGDTGFTDFTFTVTRSGDTSSGGSVEFAVTGGFADGSDFPNGMIPGGLLTFTNNQVSKTLTIQVSGDYEFEADEAFTVSLSNPSAGGVITTASANAVILNDDPVPQATSFAIAPEFAIKAEGDAGSTPFTFTVSRSGDTSTNGSVDYQVGGVQVDGNDFLGGVLPSGTVSFGANETTKVITVEVSGDTEFEPTEDFTVTLSNPSSGSGITTENAVGKIVNDDSPPGSLVAIFAEDVWKYEGDAGATVFTFTVNRSGDAGGVGSVDYSVGGTSSAHADANDFVGSALPNGTVSFAAGETSKTIAIAVQGDTIFESTEDFSVILSNPSDGMTIVQTAASASSSIRNDDAPPIATHFSITAIDAVKDEGNSGVTEFTFAVTRSGDTSATGSVDVAVDGADVNADDFLNGVLPGGTVSFIANETSKTIIIRVQGDTSIESDESFTVTLSNPSPGSDIVTASAEGIIQNDDAAPPPPPSFAILAADAVKAEGDSGVTAFTFTVTRAGDSSSAGSIDYAVTADSADIGDFPGFVLAHSSVNFAPGETSRTLTVNVEGDLSIEGDETFTVTLSNPSVGSTITTASAQGTILNDDVEAAATLYSIAPVDAVKPEGDSGATALTFMISRSGDISGGGVVNYRVAGNGDVDVTDFVTDYLPGAGFNFLPGEANRLITIEVAGDTEIEGDEDFTVVLRTPTPNSGIDVGSAVGTILNDDAPPPTTFFTITPDDAVKAEGDAGTSAFTFTVTRSGDTAQAGSVGYAVTSSQADGGDFLDGVLPSGTVNFAAGETSKTITLDIAGDTDFESDETFTVTLSNPSAGSGITTASAAGTIQNDDPAPPATFFAIAAHDAVKAEGDAGSTAFTFTVSRSGNSSQAGSVDYAVTSAAAEGGDFAGGVLPSGSVSFAAGETSKTLTVNVAGDTQIEGDEAFAVTLSNPSAGSAITTASAGGTILNDDADPPGGAVTLIDESFDSNGDTGGFSYQDGSFGGADPQSYADGAWAAGALRIDMGGTDNSTVTDISGGWTRDFTLNAESEVTLSFLYELAQSNGYESDEVSQLLVSIDGGPPILVNSVTGDGNGGGPLTTGPQTYSAMIGVLAAGSHSLTIGGFNNKKTWDNEATELTIDDVSLVATPPVPIESSFAIAPLDAEKAEGDGGPTTLSFTVNRSGDLTADASVDFAVAGSGASAADAADFAGGLLPGGSLSFGAGESSRTLIVEVAGDTDFEGDETFLVTLSNPSPGSDIVTASAGGTILNDDSAPVGPIVLIDADFNANGDSGGFVYADGTFGGANPQAYAEGSWQNQALTIALGGIDGSDVLDISGAWESSFVLATEMNVTLSFSYELILSPNFEADEFGQVLYSLDGGPAVLVDQVSGNGNGGAADTTGPQSYLVDLGPLAAGTHSVALGGFINQKTFFNESADLIIDDVLVTGEMTVVSDVGGASGGSPSQPPTSDPLAPSQEIEILTVAGL